MSKPSIHFSYKQTSGKGGNPFVARVKTELEAEFDTEVEMRHTEKVGMGLDKGYTEAHPEWWEYWKAHAEEADYVVCFDDKDKKCKGGEEEKKPKETDAEGNPVMVKFGPRSYQDSPACQKELTWCKNNKKGKYAQVGGLINEGKSAKEVAEAIVNRFIHKDLSAFLEGLSIE